MILFFDTETSGVFPGQICQLSYITYDMGEIVGKNFYFEVDYVSPSASAVNHLTVPLLKKLSGGKKFCDFVEEIEKDFSSAGAIIAHNSPFDIKFMSAEFARLKKVFFYNRNFCTMRHFTNVLKLKGKRGFKYPSLTELKEFCGVNDKSVEELINAVFGNAGFSLHDARSDTAIMFLCMLKNSGDEVIKEILEL